MSWTEQPDGSWSRPLDCHDRLFQYTSDQGKPLDREHWLLVGNVRLELPSTKLESAPDELRQAWKSLRMQHPDIALELTAEGEKRYHPVRSQQALDAWCDATFRIESDEVPSADYLFTHRLRRADPQATCHWIPASRELVLVSQHWRWDGCGLLMMLHELLAQWEHPTSGLDPVEFDGREATRLVPSLDVVLGMAEKAKTCAPSWEKQADELLGTFLAGVPSIGVQKLPSEPTPPALPGKTLRVEHVVPREQTTSLRRAARAQHGVTVTSAVHASAIAATVRVNPSSPSSRFTSWAMFDLRKHCPPPFDGPLHAPSLRTLGLPINLAARDPWPDLARALHAIYHQPWTPPASDLLYVRVPFVDKSLAMLAQPPPPNLPPPSEPSISSLGVLDRYVQPRYGDVGVADVSLAVHMLSQQLYVHVWSWNGELHLSTCFNEMYYTREFVEKWLADVVGILVENLLLAPNQDS